MRFHIFAFKNIKNSYPVHMVPKERKPHHLPGEKKVFVLKLEISVSLNWHINKIHLIKTLPQGEKLHPQKKKFTDTFSTWFTFVIGFVNVFILVYFSVIFLCKLNYYFSCLSPPLPLPNTHTHTQPPLQSTILPLPSAEAPSIGESLGVGYKNPVPVSTISNTNSCSHCHQWSFLCHMYQHFPHTCVICGKFLILFEMEETILTDTHNCC